MVQLQRLWRRLRRDQPARGRRRSCPCAWPPKTEQRDAASVSRSVTGGFKYDNRDHSSIRAEMLFKPNDHVTRTTCQGDGLLGVAGEATPSRSAGRRGRPAPAPASGAIAPICFFSSADRHPVPARLLQPGSRRSIWSPERRTSPLNWPSSRRSAATRRSTTSRPRSMWTMTRSPTSLPPASAW